MENAAAAADDGGMAVVRVKPLGAGGGGVEAGSSIVCGQGRSAVVTEGGGITVAASGRTARNFKYPKHVIPPESDQTQLYNTFMPQRIEAFLGGCNVNIMAYGQTGSGKTHTMFGPPGMMKRAATGEIGADAHADYGLCPRGVLDAISRVNALRTADPSMRYLLTASAVELTFTSGNLDMLLKGKRQSTEGQGYWKVADVSIDMSSRPPRLYGMTQAILTRPEDALELFAGIACRNTSGTGLNDTSSRSHCFVVLTLLALDTASSMVRTSRFQFVDLAGSERVAEAHSGDANWRNGNSGVIEGVSTNYSLMMLSSCVRALVEARSKKQQQRFSFRSYLVDLVQLLSESISGEALSLVIVCISSNPENASQSVNALDFGEVFSHLSVRPRVVDGEKFESLESKASKLVESGGHSVASAKMMALRSAQGRDGEQLQRCLEALRG